MRARLGLPARYALFVGALSGRKNVAGLLTAWQRAQKEIDADVELVIAGGSGPSRRIGKRVSIGRQRGASSAAPAAAICCRFASSLVPPASCARVVSQRPKGSG